MAAAEEFIEYQKYLVSDQREKLIHPHIYTNTISEDAREDLRVLDFGCGHGYTAMLLAHLPLKGLRVYACDCDEECLDVLWGRIAHRVVKNLTAFHISNYSRIYIPGWLPAIDHVFFSFSVSALEHPDISLPQIVEQMPAGTHFHFVDWDAEKNHPQIDIFVPHARRIRFEDFKSLIEFSGLTLQHEEKAKSVFYTLRAVKT